MIRPRGDILKDRARGFDLAKAFSSTDEEFCKHFGIDMAELHQAKRNRYRHNDHEKDYLWKYVHSI